MDPLDSLESVLTRLGEIEGSAGELKFPSIAEAMPHSNEIVNDLARIQDDFSRLKFNYVELESRQMFLDTIAADDLSEALDPEITKSLEEEATQGKEKLRVTKESQNALKQQIRARLDHTLKAWDSYKAKRENLGKQIASIKKHDAAFLRQLEELVAAGDRSVVLGGVEMDSITLSSPEQVQEVVAKQRHFYDVLTADLEQQQQQVRALEEEITPLRAKVQKLRSEAAQQGVAALPDAEGSMEWYEANEVLLADLSGISIDSLTSSFYILQMQLPHEGAPSFKLKFQVDPDSHRLVGLHVIPSDGQSLVIPLNDIVDACLRKQSVAFAIREIYARLDCWQTRRLEVEALDQVEADKSMTKIKLVFPKLAVKCHIKLSFMYPSPFESIRIVNFIATDRNTTIPEKELHAIKKDVNDRADAWKPVLHSLTAFHDKLRDTLQQL